MILAGHREPTFGADESEYVVISCRCGWQGRMDDGIDEDWVAHLADAALREGLAERVQAVLERHGYIDITSDVSHDDWLAGRRVGKSATQLAEELIEAASPRT